MRGARVVVHLAAFTDVDSCEAQPELARRVNHIGTRNVADAAADHGIRLIYVSTDYVFDGTKTTEYEESDEPNPLNVYGQTKLAGESKVARLPDHWIVRTSWIFGDGPNFIRTVLSRGREGSTLRIVEDQMGRPTSANGLAEAIVTLTDMKGEGLVHVAGDGEPCSWADLARFSLGSAGLDVPVEGITTEAYKRESKKTVAPRPLRSILGLQKARNLGIPLLDWRASVKREIGTMA
jgi:dTDP-4-dehydrorhamnose reductase